MTFQIPNEASATYGDQAEIDAVDIDIIQAAFLKRGIISGLVATAAGGSLIVNVSSGVGVYNGASMTYAGGNTTLSAAHATLNRFDLVILSNAVTPILSSVTGTPSSNPSFPAITASNIVLAVVFVPAAATTLTSGNIVAHGFDLSGIFVGGVTSGQTITGGNGASENLLLKSTSSSTLGVIGFESATFAASFATSVTPRFTFDTNDYFEYNRTGNGWTHYIASVQKMFLSASSFQIGVDGSAPLMTLAAVDGTNAGGSLTFNGSGANQDWVFNNQAGVMRIFDGSTAQFSVSTTTTTINGILDHDGSSIGFFATTPTTKQVSGANLTNNVTVGGSSDVIADVTDITTYSNAGAGAAIRNDIYQLSRKLKQINDGLRAYGLFT